MIRFPSGHPRDNVQLIILLIYGPLLCQLERNKIPARRASCLWCGRFCCPLQYSIKRLIISRESTYLSLTHWGRVTHICVGKLSIIGSDNGLSPGRRQAIIRTNAGILLIGPLGTNFSEIWIGIQTFSLKKIHTKMSSGKCWPFFLGLNVLTIVGSNRSKIWQVSRQHYCREACHISRQYELLISGFK